MSRDEIETVLDALLTGLVYTTDAEGFPEQFKPGVVRRDVAQIKAAVALLERALGGVA